MRIFNPVASGWIAAALISGAALGQEAGVALGSGPHRAVMESNPTLPTHTLYRPADLKSLKSASLPIVLWGNGGCANAGNRFRWFLSEIASYGFLVVAVGPIGVAGGKMMAKPDLIRLHAPTAYISGDSSDIAFPNANDDFERLGAIPVLRAYERGVPHSGTYGQPGGGEFGGVVVAWLQWQLQGNARAGRMFSGVDCGLCLNPRWVVQQKRIP